MTERDERALRQALQDLGSDDPVDLGQVRRRAAERRRNGRTVVGVAVALVLLAGVVGLPQLLTGGGGSPSSAAGGAAAEPESRSQEDTGGGGAEPEAGPPPRQLDATPKDSAPEGRRTEYYRDISFEVPASWGYAVPPGTDWCADGRGPTPRPDQRTPYVWLDMSRPVRSIGCPAMPATLLTEHVEARSPGPAVDYVEGAVRQGDWWVVTRFAGSAVLVVTTKERSRAEEIVDSAQVGPEGAPCPPASPIAGSLGTRPDGGTDLSRRPRADEVVLCQYEPAPDPADAKLPRLRATLRLDRAASRAFVDQLAGAPVNDQVCDPAVVDQRPDLAVLVRITTDGVTQDVNVAPAGCPDGGGMAGGIDDGTTVRVLTRGACQRLLTPPVAIWSASGDVGRNCLG